MLWCRAVPEAGGEAAVYKTEGYAGGVRRPEVESYGAGRSGEQHETYAAWLVSGFAFLRMT
jgi:hypothetical protein